MLSDKRLATVYFCMLGLIVTGYTTHYVLYTRPHLINMEKLQRLERPKENALKRPTQPKHLNTTALLTFISKSGLKLISLTNQAQQKKTIKLIGPYQKIHQLMRRLNPYLLANYQIKKSLHNMLTLTANLL